MFGSYNRKTSLKFTVSLLLGVVIVLNSVPLPALASYQMTRERVTNNPPEKITNKEKSLLSSSPGTSGKKPAVETFAGPPLSFETNKGQADATVKFLAHSGSGGVLLSSRETTLLLTKTKANVKNAHSRSATLDPPSLTALRMKLQGANPNPKVIGLDELPGKTNYFLGNDSSKWRTEIPNYKRVRYDAVYSGIDVIYYGNQNQLEYDFVVSPYADPSSIKIRFDNHCKLRISRNGDLLISSGGIQVRQFKPTIYQNSGAGKIAVSGRYVLRNREVTFELGAYNRSKTLIIDPLLSYSSYLWAQAYDIALDSARNMYVVGAASGTTLPLVNPVQSTSGGSTDIYVQKFDPTGSTLLFSTYLGGSDRDDGNGSNHPSIAVDPSGNIYVRGNTSSTDFPTMNAIQATYGGGFLDAFVAKLNGAGSQLIYSTYLGGSSHEEGGGITVDQFGNAYVTGGTYSTNFPTYHPLMPPSCDGNNRDVFVSVLDSTGSNFIYSTHIGGGTNQGDEAGQGIAVDAAGNAYVTGRGSSMFPTTPGAYQTTGIGGFIIKVNPDGSALLYSSLLSGAIGATDIAIDGSGNAYITGSTSGDLPTVNAFQPSYAGNSDAFVARLDVTGSSLLYASYFGGSGSDFGEGIAVDSDGNAYLTGETLSGSSFPRLNPVQPTMGGGGGFPDAFVAKVAASGTSLIFSTFLGGSGQDEGHGIAVDSDGNAYVTGWTNSSIDFPTVNPNKSSGPGGFLSKYTGLKAYKITGHITDVNSAGLSGVTVSLTGAQNKTTQTDANGDYIFTNLLSASNYTVTPTKAGFSFSPVNKSFTNLSADQVANFTTLFYSVSGRVTDALGAGLNGATLTLSGTQTLTTQTDPNGNYTFPSVPANVNYTLTPSKPDLILTYSFVPASQAITNLTANQVINFSSSNCVVRAMNSTADAYVQDGTAANSNFGLATSLKVETDSKTNNNKNFDTYLKFDASGVAGNITSAKLRIFASSSTTAGVNMSVYSVSNLTWAESGASGITWNNKPTRGAAQSNATINTTTLSTYDLDVTTYVRNEKSAGRDLISLALHNTSSSTVFVTLNSREAVANKPQLIVTTSPSANTAPAVALTNPTAGTPLTAPASILVSANATDTDGTISKVEFYSGTTPIGTATTAPYQITWGSVGVGSYSLTVVATDNSSASTVSAPVAISVNLPNIAPTVTLDSPLAGSKFSAGSNIALSATANDLDGTISKVEFFAGALLVGTATVPTSGSVYSVTWTNANSGAYALTAKATDNVNGTTPSSAVNINVVSQTGLSATADAYVRDGASATTNFGTATELQTQVSATGSNRETYIKFDITTVTGIVNAKLRLYGRLSDTSGTNVPATVYPVLTSAPDLTESGSGSITWNNKPGTGPAITSVTVTNNTARWYEWNIGDYVKAEKDAGRNIIKLAIKNTAASTPFATFNSKEADSNRPQLILWTTQARNALLVANTTTLGNGDNAIKTRLQNLGYTVTVKGSGNNNAIQTSDATGKTLVLISSSVTSANVLAKFRHVAVPIIIWKADLFDDHGMTGTTANDFGTATAQTKLTITNSAHPLAAGQTGSPIVSTSSSFTWGKPTGSPVTIATLFGDATKFVIFGYDNTATMSEPNFNAPARRVGFFLTDLTANGLTPEGNSLLDAAVKWAAELVTTPVISNLTPANGPAGTTVTISGSNFGITQGASVVSFNSANAAPTSWSDTSVVVTVPSFGTTGPVVITVSGVASNGMIFSVAATDSDGDGLADAWELQYFGNLSQSASGDPDGDGLTNLQEFQQGRNPTKSALADNGDFVNLKLYTPLLPLP
jgi:Bacterial Ig domain/Carboxypeptidase regulatory-like domain/IPT/TIG domain/Beta-propeller repeat